MNPYMKQQIETAIVIVGLFIIAVFVILNCGCAMVNFHVQVGNRQYNGTAITFFKNVYLMPFNVGTNGEVTAQGYKSNGDIDSLEMAGGIAAKIIGGI